MGKDWDNPDYFPLRDRSKEAAKSGRDVANYGIGYARGKQVDNIDYSKKGREAFISFLAEIMTEARRVLKPGGHALVWSLPRTSHWTAYALEDAGFEIRDSIEHVFGSGFPKSHNISIAIDKMHGTEREIVGVRSSYRPNSGPMQPREGFQDRSSGLLTAPATPEAQQYAGYGSALKPAHETWWLARAPLAESSIAANVLKWGVGGLNIDACRIPGQSWGDRPPRTPNDIYGNGNGTNITASNANNLGRFPSNFLLSHSLFCTEELCDESCPVLALDRQSGIRKSSNPRGSISWSKGKGTTAHEGWQRNAHANYQPTTFEGYGDVGGASRFFQTFYYCPKPSKREKSAGCDDLPERQGFDKNTSQQIAHVNHTTGETTYNEYNPSASKNHHPTVKPVSLLKYFITMITPPGGIVLDMFGGSGTTAVAAIESGFNFIIVEREQEYIDIINARVKHALAEKKEIA